MSMKPLEKVYWLRLALGIIAALLCTGFDLATNAVSSSKFAVTDLMNGIALALITYLLSYYVIKALFVTKVQKPQKLFTTGIGVYLLSWAVFWVMFYTFLAR